jgi:hypothetical protein
LQIAEQLRVFVAHIEAVQQRVGFVHGTRKVGGPVSIKASVVKLRDCRFSASGFLVTRFMVPPGTVLPKRAEAGCGS